MKILTVLDPLEKIKISYDSTFFILCEAQARGHLLYFCTPAGLSATTLGVDAQAASIKITHVSSKKETTDESKKWCVVGEETKIPLTEFDAVLMRKDPPFDMEYIYATYLLEHAARQGVRVFNSPSAIRDHNEKYAILEFSKFLSPTLVTRSAKDLREFVQEYKEVVLKPLDGMGGGSVFHLHYQDVNVSVIIETLNKWGERSVMAQRYIPEIKQGDKRILLIAGQVVPHALARIPTVGEFRGNLSAGGRGVAGTLSLRDREIAEELAPKLFSRGLFLVGLDVIGDYLTEINVTSPTGFRQIHDQTGFNVAESFILALEGVVQVKKECRPDR